MRPSRVTAAAAVLLLCAAGAAPARELPAAPTPATWTAIRTPIPRAKLLAALDLDPALPRALTLIEVVRRLHEDDTRRGTLRGRLAATLSAGRPGGPTGRNRRKADVPPVPVETAPGAPASTDDDLVPLPLTETFWESCITGPRKVPGSVGAAIVTDAAVGLMYVALTSTDGSTRLFLAGQCERVSAIARARAAAFSVVARSFRVRGGRLDLPGGDEALALWRRLGLPVTEPSEFLMRLVSTDVGRLAYFYDTIAQLDPVRQRFALGLTGASGVDTEIGAGVYRVCADSDPSWSIVDRPFARMAVDVALVLQLVRLTPEGRVAGPVTEAFLSAAFADGDIDRGRDEASASLDGVTDAAALVRLVMVPDWIRRRTRLLTLLYAQRVFPALQREDAADALAALRGIAKVETLPFALERIGVESPGLIASAVRRALQLGQPLGGVAHVPGERQRAEISAFQASLVLIERLVHVRALDLAAAGDLVRRLLDEGTADPLGYPARVARWIETDLLARIRETERREPTAAAVLFGPAAPTQGELTGDPREHRLLEALAGRAPDPPILVEWEEVRYRMDIASAERARLRAIRVRQGGPMLDDALDLIASARALRSAGDADDLAQVRAAVARLAGHLVSAGAGEGSQGGPAADSRPGLAAAARALESGRLSPAERVQHARHLAELGGVVLGDVLRSFVYACALGDADGQAFLAGDVAQLHEFGLDEPDASRRRGRAWELPSEVGAGGQPWHLTGSLLAVDLAVSRFALRRALGDMPARQPMVSGADRRTLVATMALMNPADMSDATRDVLVQAMRRGREVLDAALARGAAADAAVNGAGINGWRAQLLSWARAFEPDGMLRMVARSELVWLGTREPLPAEVHAWGAPTQTIDGAWRLQFPGPEPTDAVAGRQASAYLPGRFADLTLRLAEIMADLRVPSALTREVLRMALQRFVDEARPAYPDDWLALARHAGALPRAQVEDHVYALTVADGPLVPAEPVSEKP